jgi:hypothetical protein
MIYELRVCSAILGKLPALLKDDPLIANINSSILWPTTFSAIR